MENKDMIQRRTALLSASSAALLAVPGLSRAQGALAVGGSTAGQGLLIAWLRRFSPSTEYRGIGSGAGMAQVGGGTLDIGLTDVPMTAGQLQAAQLAQVPLFADGIAIVANLPGVTSFRLSPDAVADIYRGINTDLATNEVNRRNPTLKLSGTAQGIGRSDESGSTNTVSQFLSSSSRAWQKSFGSGMSLRWPAAVELVRGSSAMLAAVKAKPGAFGYLSLADAARSGLAVASIDGNAGVVVPSGNSVLAAVNAASWDAVTNAASLDRVRAANAWPLTFVVYALYKPKANNAAAVKRLLADMTIAGQTDVAAASVVSVGQAGLAAAARGIAA